MTEKFTLSIAYIKLIYKYSKYTFYIVPMLPYNDGAIKQRELQKKLPYTYQKIVSSGAATRLRDNLHVILPIRDADIACRRLLLFTSRGRHGKIDTVRCTGRESYRVDIVRPREVIFMTRLAFFDMDGTLCAPRFYVNGNLVPGMSDEDWTAFCKKNGADTYRFCKTVTPVAEYAAELRARGAELYVLTAVQTEEEIAAKRKYTQLHFPGMFTDVIGVEHDADKLDVIAKIAKEKGIAAEECELVEDTYSLVLKATVAGIRATHVSHLICKRD